MKNLYKILGVNITADKAEIKKRYRELAKKYHPDKLVNASQEEKIKAEKIFREINNAYTILSDEEKRKKYDETLTNSSTKEFNNSKKTTKTRHEDENNYKDIYEQFNKANINDMFGKFFNPKKSTEQTDGRLKEQTNNMFESFFSFNGRKKK